MTEEELKNLKYPIDGFRYPQEVSTDEMEEWKDIIAGFPELLENIVNDISEDQLSWNYRPDGWNILQVIHHLADSHLNSFIRFKLTLTEDDPTIKPYYEDRWANLPDVINTDINLSLDILRGVHGRWSVLLESLTKNDFLKTYTHPEHGRKIRLDQTVALYAWHCNHHLAHINQALYYEGKFNQ